MHALAFLGRVRTRVVRQADGGAEHSLILPRLLQSLRVKHRTLYSTPDCWFCARPCAADVSNAALAPLPAMP